jgi:N-acetylneuraminate lyase
VDENGDIKEMALRKLVKHLLNAGCNGFYICGATGEGVVMKPESRKILAEIVVDEVGGRGCVIDHIGAIDLRTSHELARHASDTGVDAISSVPPFFYNYGDNEIIDYYKALSEAANVPIIIYASPLTGITMSLSLVEKLFNIPKVEGIKWTNFNYYHMNKIKEMKNGAVKVFNGPDETLVCGLIMGADAGIGSTYNIMPDMYTKLYRDFYSGNITGASIMQFKINKVIDILLKYGVIPGIKYILEMQGFDVGYCISPMKRFSNIEGEAFRGEMIEVARRQEIESLTFVHKAGSGMNGATQKIL